MRNKFIASFLFCVAVAGGYFMPEKVAAQAPAVLFGMNSGVPQPISSTGGALWVTVAGGNGTFQDIIARSVTSPSTANLTLAGGVSGTGLGRNVLINGGDSTGTNGGGDIVLSTGNGSGSGASGDFELSVGTAGATGYGGQITIEAGDGVGGGQVVITAGNGTSDNGGDVTITAGSSSSALAGTLLLQGSGSASFEFTTSIKHTINATLEAVWGTAGLVLKSDYALGWSDGAASSAADVGLAREAAGVLEVTNGSSGRGVIDASEYRVDNVPLGTWTTPGFNAGNFTGGAGTWTVAAGDVTTYEYTTTGYTMHVNFQIYTSTVAGTTNVLSIAIPNSKVSTHETEAAITIIDNGVNTTGRAIVTASGTTIQIKRTNDANFAASTDNTYILGQIVFQIN